LQYKLNAAETWQLTNTITSGASAGASLAAILGFSYKGTGVAGNVQNSFGLFNAVPTGNRAIANPGALTACGFQFAAPSTQTVISVSVNVIAENSYQASVCEIYADVGGNPINLLGQATFYSFGQWNFPSPIPINNGVLYWIVFLMDANQNVEFSTVTQAGTGFNSGRAANIASIGVDTNMNINENFCWNINTQAS
jgi:hypothetical protein